MIRPSTSTRREQTYSNHQQWSDKSCMAFETFYFQSEVFPHSRVLKLTYLLKSTENITAAALLIASICLPHNSTSREQPHSSLFLRDGSLLRRICCTGMENSAWLDHIMHSSNTCTEWKWLWMGRNHRLNNNIIKSMGETETEWVAWTWYLQNAKFQLDFPILYLAF